MNAESILPPPGEGRRPHIQPIFLSSFTKARLAALAASRKEQPGRTAALIVERALAGGPGRIFIEGVDEKGVFSESADQALGGATA